MEFDASDLKGITELKVEAKGSLNIKLNEMKWLVVESSFDRIAKIQFEPIWILF